MNNNLNILLKQASFDLNVLISAGVWGSAPEPSGWAYDAPPHRLIMRGFAPLIISRPFCLGQNKILATGLKVCQITLYLS